MLSDSSYVMTLANSIIGVGILAMPFCFQKCGIILSIALLMLSYVITRISCHYLIKSALLTRRKSFELLAFHAFGPSGKLMVELCVIGYLFGTCIAYYVVVGDLGPQIVAKILQTNENDQLRTWVMIIVTILCIIPLALLKNVDSLSVVCTASIGFYFCLVTKVIAESKNHIIENDWMNNVEYWKPSGVLQCLPIFSMALSCQMQLFEVIETIPNQSLEKCNALVKNATRICTCVYIAVGIFGYIAFSNKPFSGNILVNFSPSLASDVIKIGFVLSVAFSFPLVIFPCRASLYSLLYKKGHTADTSGYIPEARFKAITFCIVFTTLILGILIPSIELVIGLVGSTIGVAICIMFPASCFLKVSKKESSEKSLAKFILIGGFCLMILGTYANLNAIDEKRSGSHSGSKDDDGNIPVHMPKKSVESLQNNTQQKQQINISPTPILSKKILEKSIQIDNKEIPKLEEPPKVPPIKIDNTIVKEIELGNKINLTGNNKNDNFLNNNINKDAIKKDEEVAAEENVEKEKSIQEAELELKKTKELLEKKVDELKLELAKQNQEAQHLVIEKLDNIAEKVDEIERKVDDVNKEVEDNKKHMSKEEKLSNKENNAEINTIINAKKLNASKKVVLNNSNEINENKKKKVNLDIGNPKKPEKQKLPEIINKTDGLDKQISPNITNKSKLQVDSVVNYAKKFKKNDMPVNSVIKQIHEKIQNDTKLKFILKTNSSKFDNETVKISQNNNLKTDEILPIPINSANLGINIVQKENKISKFQENKENELKSNNIDKMSTNKETVRGKREIHNLSDDKKCLTNCLVDVNDEKLLPNNAIIKNFEFGREFGRELKSLTNNDG